MLLSGCAGAHAPSAAPPTAAPFSTTAPLPVSPAPTTTTSTTAPHLPGLGSGDSGPAVLAVEKRLAALHYDVGTPDGHFGPADTYAVTAFQKVHGLARNGRATDDVVALLASDHDPASLVPGGGAMRVEVDIARQVLFLYEHDVLVRILPVSTGSGQRYCVQGACDVAVTPGGSYRVFRKLLGQDVSKLGVLYNPLYFNGGIAIHGEPDDPAYPASHGCVRIPMAASLWFYNEVPDGTPVYVIGGPNAPVPFHAQAPPDTTTTAPASTTTSSSTTSVPGTTVPPTTVPGTTVPPTTTVPTTAVPTTAVPTTTTR
jgi:peptidoglycan hydrolase-like protein with peptidoglycan-binding domain